MSDKQRLRGVLQILLGAIAIAAAVAIFMYFRSTKKEPEQQEIAERVAIAHAVTAESNNHDVIVRANGTVKPARDVHLASQVSGRVSWISESLNAGKIVREGEDLFRIDTTDYRLAVQQAQAQVESAQSQLQIEEGRGRVAQREWELFAQVNEDEAPNTANRNTANQNPELAQREPQLRAAQVQVESARAQLDQARSNLRRTTVTAPFDAYVEARNIELGAYTSPQSPAAHLVGIEHFWVEVALKTSVLPWIDFAQLNGGGGSRATVSYDLGQSTIEREGVVLRLLQSLDAQGRMARVLVQIDDPLNLEEQGESAEGATDEARLPLLIGSFVTVTITGPTLPDVIAVPRQAQRGANEVWIVSDDERLSIRTINPVWSDSGTVFVPSGESISPGDRLIVTSLASAVEGLKLDIREAESADSDEQGVQPAAAGPEDAADVGGQ